MTLDELRELYPDATEEYSDYIRLAARFLERLTAGEFSKC